MSGGGVPETTQTERATLAAAQATALGAERIEEMRERALAVGRLGAYEAPAFLVAIMRDEREDPKLRMWCMKELMDRFGLPAVTRSEGEVRHVVDADAVALAVEEYERRRLAAGEAPRALPAANGNGSGAHA